MAPGVVVAEADECPARSRIHVRRPLPGEIRQEDQAVGPGADRRRFLAQQGVGPRRPGQAGLVAQPAQRQPRREDRPQNVVDARHGVDEDMQTRIGGDPAARRPDRDEDLPAAARRDRGHPRPQQAVADGLGRLVGTAGDHRDTGRQAQRGGGFRQQRPGHVRRLQHFREDALRQPGRRQDRRGPAPPGDVEHAAAGGIADLGSDAPGQAQPDVILGEDDPAYPGQALRLVARQPEQRGAHEARRRERARQPGVTLRPQRSRQGGAFGGAALVGPDDGRAKRRAGFIEQNRAVHLAAEADGGDIGASGRRDRLARRADRRLPPGLRILLGAVGGGLEHRVLPPGDGQDPGRFGIEQHGFGARRPDVKTQQQRHGGLPGGVPATGSWLRRTSANYSRHDRPGKKLRAASRPGIVLRGRDSLLPAQQPGERNLLSGRAPGRPAGHHSLSVTKRASTGCSPP